MPPTTLNSEEPLYAPNRTPPPSPPQDAQKTTPSAACRRKGGVVSIYLYTDSVQIRHLKLTVVRRTDDPTSLPQLPIH